MNTVEHIHPKDIDDEIEDDHLWDIIGDHLKETGFADTQITSFDQDYILKGIPRVFNEEPDVVIRPEHQDIVYTLSFGQTYIPGPTLLEDDRTLRTHDLFPAECRERDITYSSPIYVDITETTQSPDAEPVIVEHKRVLIGRTPIMLRSGLCNLSRLTPKERIKAGECPRDPGGYFIIKGNERVVVPQSRKTYNKVLVLKQKSNDKMVYVAEIRSMSEETGHSVQVTAAISSENASITFGIQQAKGSIPAAIIFKALGFTEDEQIKDFIGLNHIPQAAPLLEYMLRDAYFARTQDDALLYIGKNANNNKENERRDIAWQIVESNLLPHLGVTSTLKEKAYFFGHMLNKLIATFLGLRAEDDIDNYANKRVDSCGTLFFDLFRTLFKGFTSKLVQDLEKKTQTINAIPIISRSTAITTGILRCASTGNWGAKKSFIKPGVAQVLSRLSYGATLSHLRHLMYQTGKEGRNIKIRQINPSQCMFLCVTGDTEVVAEDGINCVQIKNLQDNCVVRTISPDTLQEEPSMIKNYFSAIPTKLLKVTTMSGRVIKCTPEHPFLVKTGNKNKWIKAVDIKTNQLVVVRNTLEQMDISDGTLLTNFTISEMEIFARLIGALETGGHVYKNREGCEFYVGEEQDGLDIVSDIQKLGFSKPFMKQKTSHFKDIEGNITCTHVTYQIRPKIDFFKEVIKLGCTRGKKINSKKIFPLWILEAPSSVRREFLAGFQGGDGGVLQSQKNGNGWTVRIGHTCIHCSSDVLEFHVEYMNTIVSQFNSFDIDCHLSCIPLSNNRHVLKIFFSSINENVCRYGRSIGYRYCHEKTRASNIVYEYARIRQIKYNEINQRYNQARELRKEGFSILQIAEKTCIKYTTVRRIISDDNEKPKSIEDMVAFDTFKQLYCLDSDSITIPVKSIEECDIEEVYDFTTISSNHSFIANGFVTHNCPAECFDPETPILLWDSTVKRAGDIVVGDTLIDDQGQPTRVKTTCAGLKEMYEIQQTEANAMNYTVTDNHILTLKIKNTKWLGPHKEKYNARWFDRKKMRFRSKLFPNKEEARSFLETMHIDPILDIKLSDYLKLPGSVTTNLRGFKSTGISWPKRDIALDPYILGMWLGDELSNGYGFSTADEELLNTWVNWGKDNNATVHRTERYKYTLQPSVVGAKKGIAPLRNILETYGLLDNRHIPQDYIFNDRETRLQLLAGLVDTDGSVRDGHEIRICQSSKNIRILEDTLRLAQSLGFACHMNNGIRGKCSSTYTELTLTGEYLYEIPVRLARKKAVKFDNPRSIVRCQTLLETSINVVRKSIGSYVGWQLEGNGRFLLADCTTIHNTPEGAKIGLVLNLSLLTTITVRIPTIVVREAVESATEFISARHYTGDNYLPKVFLNGVILGFTHNHTALLEELKTMRKIGLLPYQVSVSYDLRDREIHVFSDEGRLLRPVLTTCEDGTLSLKKSYGTDWSTLVKMGCIHYVDNNEVENSVVAFQQKELSMYQNNYCELNPAMMLGVMASIIPWPDHSQAPRNCYQCLHPSTLIDMADGSKKAIGDVRKGDKVITVHPVTCETSITTVINQYVKTTDKRMITIHTEFSRKLVCTDDHLLLSTDGWVAADKAKNVYDVDKGLYVNITSRYEYNHGNIIADITTESANHSFIAGGLCVHNSSMGKQAMGMFALSHSIRTDTCVHVLSSPQRPLVSTKAADIMGFNDMPSGLNAIVAIACYTGLTLVGPLSRRKTLASPHHSGRRS